MDDEFELSYECVTPENATTFNWSTRPEIPGYWLPWWWVKPHLRSNAIYAELECTDYDIKYPCEWWFYLTYDEHDLRTWLATPTEDDVVHERRLTRVKFIALVL